MADKPRFEKSTEQVWKESLLEDKPEVKDPGRNFGDHDRSAYVGVSPEYQNYSTEADMPRTADKGVNKELEEKYADSSNRVVNGEKEEGASESDSEEGEGQSATPPSPPVSPSQSGSQNPAPPAA